jgi:hypothetical protein
MRIAKIAFLVSASVLMLAVAHWFIVGSLPVGMVF